MRRIQGNARRFVGPMRQVAAQKEEEMWLAIT
jgi:hypothetical protein